jgi:hypothetical protein
MVISSIIALVVDRAAKQRLLADFASDVSSHIIGRYLPQGLREHIQDYLTVNVVRRHWDIRYTISKIVGNEGFVKLDTEIVSELMNCSAHTLQVPVVFEVDESWYPQIGTTTITEAYGLGVDYRYGDKSGPARPVEDGRVIFKRSVSLPPHSSDGSTNRVTLKSTEYFASGGLTSLFTTYPVLSTELTVIYPIEEFRVDLDLTYEEVSKEADREELEQGVRWKLKGPMLRGQGFTVRWQKKGGGAGAGRGKPREQASEDLPKHGQSAQGTPGEGTPQ